jgi:gp16 family phage-associated protein
MAERKVKTPGQVKAEFLRRGDTITAWAREHGFNANQVVAVLSGRNKGLRGNAHNIAIMLGIKQGEIRKLDEPTQRAA